MIYNLLDFETKNQTAKFDKQMPVYSLYFYHFWSKCHPWQNRYHLKAIFMWITMVQVPASYDLSMQRYEM